MALQYTNTPTMPAKKPKKTFREQFDEEVTKSRGLAIAVDAASVESLRELDHIIDQNQIENVILILRTYWNNGAPKAVLEEALRLAVKWKARGIGEISLVHSVDYLGNVYCFYSRPGSNPFIACVGSGNLCILDPLPAADWPYELSISTRKPEDLQSLEEEIQELAKPIHSVNLLDVRPEQLTLLT